ncbi:hypothetical protein NQ315_007786 [Exocentrus adspersus]|uniref:DEUBAD domain-containing protein n=1 Tax=Exocentrus adspersus TaxID=1586481 RepID=A0AAV8WAF3_9CUCU|nr:hypothetical protein NQ315_007786 [Exocentrus adspersus]
MDENSSSEDSSSDYTTESSEDDGMETAQINGTKLQLPHGLCERQDIFREILSTEVWNSFSDVNKQHLQTFLPNFPENDDLEKTKTLQRLFDFETFRFTSPLVKFHDDLKAGYFRPDIARMRKIIRKAERKEAKYRYKTFREQLKHEVIESQHNLLNQIRCLPPGVEPKQEKRKVNVDYVSHRTKRKYFQILSSIRLKTEDTGCSSDENYPEGAPISLSRKQKRHLNSIRSSLNSSKDKFFSSTMTAKLNGFSVDLEKYITPSYNPFYVNDDSYKNLIYQHKRRKLENPEDLELNTRGITISDIVNRTQLPYNKNMPIISKHQSESKVMPKKEIEERARELQEIPRDPLQVPKQKQHRVSAPKPKHETKKELQPITVSSSASTVKVNNANLTKPINNISHYGKITPVRVEDLDGIDVMNIPIDLDNSDIDILELSNKPELMQDTHANFFSLIRDVICSTSEHRMNMYTLQERLKSWQENPISPLNDWYSYTDNWISILPSAITFLCGNASEQPDDFVPYMEYKVALDVYQWIGAGRDSDNLLSSLCSFWLEHRAEEEIKDFREQERKRYDNPHKAFTYRCNNYESVVGPLKGVYNPAAGSAKARGHTMLSADRPNFVTILSLVRDAAARLPNGEGTRGEICELLKSSQYISPTAPDNILQSVVSGALDRMHTQWDPCVKYDPKKKIWIYLHRNRTEEDFERIHQHYQGMNKTKKPPAKKSPAKPKVKQTAEKTGKTNAKSESVQQSQSSQPEQATKASRRPSLQQQQSSKANQPAPTQNTSPANVTTSVNQQSSLLLSNNAATKKAPDANNLQQAQLPPQLQTGVEEVVVTTDDSAAQSREDKEINEALAAIVQNRVSSPTTKKGKNLVKILSPTPGKSLIIPTTNSQLIKQMQEQRNTPTKQLNQVVTQQLLQTLAAQQKQMIVQKQNAETGETRPEKIKVSTSVQQQIIQGITPQQLQNIKNVTLLRAPPNQNLNLTPIANASQPGEQGDVKQDQQSVQIKTQGGSLTPAQQQQILQTIKQKILPSSGILTTQPQPVMLKQKSGAQKQSPGTSGAQGAGQQKVATDASSKPVASSQGPVVAKVLTNAAGQVISVESLLAHQKQHGSLPQGTTLRVAGAKGTQQNIIHLTGTTKPNAVAQFTVGSQNNILAIASQPKLVVASQTTTATSSTSSTKTSSRSVSKAQTLAKLSKNSTQHLINAKIVTQALDGQKIVQPKLVVGQQNQVKLSGGKGVPFSKPVTLSVAGGANTIRMVNATNLNLTHIGGKPVLLASKGGPIQNLQGQNVILQTQSSSSGASLVLQNTGKNATSALQQQTGLNNINILNQSNIVFSPQVKVQQPQQVVLGTSTKTGQVGTPQTLSQAQGHIMLGGHSVRLQTSNAASTQRVVLASQGQGGQIVAQQILLPAGFQGTAINIKALQGVKVIPIAQAQGQSKGLQSRQVFARVMNPNVVKTTQATTAVPDKIAEITLPSQTGE